MSETASSSLFGAAKTMYERLANEFAEQYMEKLFYYCLKKTGSAACAEELAADITLQVISALAKGTVPQRFSAWVWQIARNRYARWARERGIARNIFADGDISEHEMPDAYDDSNVESEYLQSEQIKLLRRELAFISREYREIVVAHYIENRRLSDIAQTLSVPEGTVKTKLFRARNILKEGMNMAREFGKRSYKPEEIDFSSCGNQPSGLPWSAVKRLIPVNVLCEANNNPSTLEELSVELGIAMPYIEEEVRILENSDLLQKTEDGKYVTSFFIAPRECIQEINNLCGDFIDKNYKAIWSLAGIAVDKAAELGALDGCITREDAQMYFAFALEQNLKNEGCTGVNTCFKRRDGGNWGFIGYENGAVIRNTITTWSNNYGSGVISYQNDSYTENWLPLNYVSQIAIKELAENSWKLDALSDASKTRIRELMCKPATVKDMGDGIYKPDMIVYTKEVRDKVFHAAENTDEYKRIAAEEKELFAKQKDVVGKYIYPLFRKDADFYAWMLAFYARHILYTNLKNNGVYNGESKAFYAVTI